MILINAKKKAWYCGHIPRCNATWTLTFYNSKVLSLCYLFLKVSSGPVVKDIGDVSTKCYQPHHIMLPSLTFRKRSPVQHSFQASMSGYTLEALVSLDLSFFVA